MKKLFCLLFSLSFLLIVVPIQAQYTFKITDATSAVKFVPSAADTLYASNVKTFVFTLPTEKAPYNFVIGYKTTQTRGTAAYTAKVEESPDGVSYYAINNADNDVNSGGGNFNYVWRSSVDTSMVTCKYVKVTMTATSAAQSSTIALSATFTPKIFR